MHSVHLPFSKQDTFHFHHVVKGMTDLLQGTKSRPQDVEESWCEGSGGLLSPSWQLGGDAQKGRLRVHEEWTQKYGKVFRYYEGGTPVLVTADPDMAREIFIKQFHNFIKQFHNFDYRITQIDNSGDPYVNMFLAKGAKWKRLRELSTPTFTARKMKLMSSVLRDSTNKLMKRLEQRATNASDGFDIYDDFRCLSMDAIASAAFSYDTDIYNTKDSPFVKHMNQMLRSNNVLKMPLMSKFLLMLYIISPSILKFIRFCFLRSLMARNDWYLRLAKKLIVERENSQEVRNDYLQLMVDMKKESNQEPAEPQPEADEQNCQNEGLIHKVL